MNKQKSKNSKLVAAVGGDKNEFELTRAMIHLMNEMSHNHQSSSSLPFTPTPLLTYMQQHVNTDILRHGDQHDVHEFLQYLLHQLHDELKLSSTHDVDHHMDKNLEQNDNFNDDYDNLDDDSSEDEWQEVGQNQKVNIVHKVHTHEQSPISDLFAGRMRSVIRKRRSGVGSLVVQPFYSLHLPIVAHHHHHHHHRDHERSDKRSHHKDGDGDGDGILSIEDSLRMITAREELDGHLASSMQIEVETVPRILVLQLIRFEYVDHRCVKIGRHVRFSRELYLDRHVISSVRIREKDPSRYFDLRAVICHHGTEASGGHYSTFVRCGGRDHQWFHVDDQTVQRVDLEHVLSSQAYVLLYERRQC